MLEPERRPTLTPTKPAVSPKGKPLAILRDATDYIMLKAKQRAPAKDRGLLMHAHVGMMLAVCEERAHHVATQGRIP